MTTQLCEGCRCKNAPLRHVRSVDAYLCEDCEEGLWPALPSLERTKADIARFVALFDRCLAPIGI